MALAPKFSGLKLVTGDSPKGVHTLELYLDFVCPFSKKLFTTIHDAILPLLTSSSSSSSSGTSSPSPYASRVTLILRPQIQPWHPSSTLVHEAALAVLRLAPADRFLAFARALFDRQTDFFDEAVVHESRNATYRRLARLAAATTTTAAGVREEEVFGLLEIRERPGPDGGGGGNRGNAVTDDVKVIVKANRLVGVHVTPTVLFNGIVENSISSSWTKEQWEEWLEKNIV